jgi:hypothetical protein
MGMAARLAPKGLLYLVHAAHRPSPAFLGRDTQDQILSETRARATAALEDSIGRRSRGGWRCCSPLRRGRHPRRPRCRSETCFHKPLRRCSSRCRQRQMLPRPTAAPIVARMKPALEPHCSCIKPPSARAGCCPRQRAARAFLCSRQAPAWQDRTASISSLQYDKARHVCVERALTAINTLRRPPV